jgi:O-acetyl-ADP-ribose deacetylase (regulator of RNase III)
VRNAIQLASEHAFRSIAFPLIGAGTGGMTEDRVLAVMQDAFGLVEFDGDVKLVRYLRRRKR